MKEYRLIVHEQVKSPVAEAYRTLRTNIQYSKIDGDLKTLLFTSAGPGEGKSTTAANTGIALAQLGKQVLILDCDLRKPAQYRIFQTENRGLTQALVEEIPPAELIQPTAVANLFLLTSGPIPPNPSELLGSKRMLEIIQSLKSQYDYLLFDTPPVLAVTDACVLASRVDGVILVIARGMVKPEIGRQAMELIVNAHGKLLGTIINRVEITQEYAYYHYYYGNEKLRTKQ